MRKIRWNGGIGAGISPVWLVAAGLALLLLSVLAAPLTQERAAENQPAAMDQPAAKNQPAAMDLAAVEVVYGQALLVGHESGGGEASFAPGEGGAGSGARVALPETFHDFGRISDQAVVSRDFLVSNSGSAPLVIERAYTTCGCTSAEFSARVIPPGKASRVTITFDAGYHPGQEGAVRRGLVIETNDPTRPQVEIWVEARFR